ncbi:MAG: hypothetical protein HRU18_26825, partial [Pseudoalteromonas sp.]|uniref:hypothetical protein n=1 Tax=Pseudoalteromonas sp. TaxID=53249 RepID=UPI001DD594D9
VFVFVVFFVFVFVFVVVVVVVVAVVVVVVVIVVIEFIPPMPFSHNLHSLGERSGDGHNWQEILNLDYAIGFS